MEDHLPDICIRVAARADAPPMRPHPDKGALHQILGLVLVADKQTRGANQSLPTCADVLGEVHPVSHNYYTDRGVRKVARKLEISVSCCVPLLHLTIGDDSNSMPQVHSPPACLPPKVRAKRWCSGR